MRGTERVGRERDQVCGFIVPIVFVGFSVFVPTVLPGAQLENFREGGGSRYAVGKVPCKLFPKL